MSTYEYRDVLINITDFDSEYKGYFDAAKDQRLVLKKCQDCGLLRGEPGPGCPWCMSLAWDWHEVSGKGTIYSYQIIAHAVMTGFKNWTPFPIVLVELDEQSGQPNPGDGLRITANLLNENMEPESEDLVAIGKRVEVTFLEAESGISLPQFKL